MSMNRIRGPRADGPLARRRSAKGQIAIGAAAMLMLTGCATTGAPGGPGATNPPATTSRPVAGSLADGGGKRLAVV